MNKHEVLKVSPRNAASYYYLADIFYREGDYIQAYRYCRNCIFFSNTFKKAYVLLAKIYYQVGYIDDAKEILDDYKIDFEKFVERLENEQSPNN